jgi:hypothetical protein
VRNATDSTASAGECQEPAANARRLALFISAVGWDQRASSERRPTLVCVRPAARWAGARRARWSHPTISADGVCGLHCQYSPADALITAGRPNMPMKVREGPRAIGASLCHILPTGQGDRETACGRAFARVSVVRGLPNPTPKAVAYFSSRKSRSLTIREDEIPCRRA